MRGTESCECWFAGVVLVEGRGRDEGNAVWNMGIDVRGQDGTIGLGEEVYDGDESFCIALHSVLGWCGGGKIMGHVEGEDREFGVCESNQVVGGIRQGSSERREARRWRHGCSTPRLR